MFKKLKDRIAEEVKQSPRIQASVQQLSQYSLFNEGSNQDLTPDGSKSDLFLPFSSSPITNTSDNSPFSIDEDDEVDQSTMKGSAPFEVVDLGQASASPAVDGRSANGRHSRTNSMGSLTGDASSIFPTYQSSYSSFHLPSDLESNASEIDEAATMYRDKVSQEQVFQGYQRMKSRYQKYKGRYADTARAYQELERENEKMKTVLAETQDKALRRMNELKEQCQLEQKAKAHLEETLRADIEEKDHKILTLNTKVDILKSNGASAVQELKDNDVNQKDEETNTEVESEEVTDMSKMKSEYEEKISRLEALLHKSKDIINAKKAKVLQLSEEGDLLKREVESEKKSADELKTDLIVAKEEIKGLKQQEEQNALAMAQTKQTMHKELEEKEAKNLNLTESVAKLTVENEGLYKQMKKMTEDLEHQQSTNEEDKKNALHELSRGKAAALQLLKQEMEHNMEVKLKEKEEEWQQNYDKKVKELEADLDRALQKADDDVHKKMSEFKNQHQMELDEKELQKMAALAESEKKIQDLDETIGALTRQKLELEQQLSQHEDSHSAACKSWEIRETELNAKQQAEMEEVRKRHQEQMEHINRKHHEEMESHAMQFKEKYVKRLAELRNEHEEALQGASSQQEEEYKKKTDLLVAQYSQDISSLKMSLIALEDEKKEGLAEKDNIIMNCQKEVEESKVKCSQLIKELEDANSQMGKCEEEMINTLKRKEEECCCIKKELEEIMKQKEALENEKEGMHSNLKSEIQKIRIQSENSLKELEGNLRKQEDDLCKEQENTLVLKESLEEKDSRIQSLEEELNVAKGMCEDNQKLLAIKEAAIEEIKKNNDSLQSQVLAAKNTDNVTSAIQSELDRTKNEQQRLETEKCQLEQHVSSLGADLAKEREDVVKLKEECQRLNNENREVEILQNEKEKESKMILDELMCIRSKCEAQEVNSNDTLMEHVKRVSLDISYKMELIDNLQEKLNLKEKENNDMEEKVKSEKEELTRKMEELQKELDKSKDEHNCTLQAVEQEMKTRREEQDQEKEQQLQEFKTLLECKENLIQDLRYRECEINKLLEKTRKGSEDKVAEINSKMKEELSQMQEKMDELNTEVDKLRAQLESSKIAHEEAVRSYQGELGQLETDLRAQLEKEQQSCVEKLARVKSDAEAKHLREMETLKEVSEKRFQDLKNESKATLSQKEEELKKMLEQISSEKEETFVKQKEEIENHTDARKLLEKNISVLKKDLHRIEEERDSLKRVLEQSDNVSNNMKKEIDVLAEKMVHSEKELESSKDTNQTLEANITNLREKYEAIQEQLERVKGCLDEKNATIEEERSKVEEVKIKSQQADKELSTLKDEFTTLTAENTSLLKLLEESKQDNLLLEEVKEEHCKRLEGEIDRLERSKAQLLEQLDGNKDLEGEKNKLQEKVVQLESDMKSKNEAVIDREKVKKQLEQKEEQVIELSDRLDNEVETNKAWQNEIEEIQRRLDKKEEEVQSLNSEWQTKYGDLKKKAELKLTMIKKQLTAEKEKEVSEAVKANNEQNVEAQELEELRSENWHLHEKVEELENALQQNQALAAKEKATEELEEKHYMKIKELAKNFELQMSETEKKHQEELDEAINNADELSKTYLVEMREDLKRSNEMLHAKSQALEDSFESHKKDLEAKDLKLSELTKFYQAQLQATERNWKQLLDEQRIAMEKRHREEVDGLTEEWQKERLQMEKSTYAEEKVGSSSGESNGSDNANLDGLIELEYLRNILYQYMMGKEPVVLAKVLATVVRFSKGQTERVLQREEQKHGVLAVGLNRKS